MNRTKALWVVLLAVILPLLLAAIVTKYADTSVWLTGTSETLAAAIAANTITGGEISTNLDVGGDITADTIALAGDGNGARVELDVNAAAPTYGAGAAGIDVTELASDPTSRLFFQDDDGNRSQIGPTYQTVRILLNDNALGNAPNASCTMWDEDGITICGYAEASSMVPEGQTYVFDKVHIITTEALDGAAENCTLFFSYGPVHADKAAGMSCTDPEACALSDQIALVHTGSVDPGNAGTALWLDALGDELEIDLGEVEVAGFWRIMVHDRFRCDAASGADQGKPCAADSECDGAGVCDEDAPAACTVFEAAEVHVHFWMYE